MSDKKFDLDKVKKQVKDKQPKETNMKKQTIITVAITLVSVAALAAYGFYMFQLGTTTERNKYESVKAEVKALTATATSKQ